MLIISPPVASSFPLRLRAFTSRLVVPCVESYSAIAAAAACGVQCGGSFPYTRRKMPFGSSSANLPHCCRVCATTVAALVLAAAFCGAKFAIQRPFPSLLLRTSAAIPPIRHCINIDYRKSLAKNLFALSKKFMLFALTKD